MSDLKLSAYMCAMHVGLMQGYSLSVSSNESQALLRIPFPDAAVWYLSLQTMCNDRSVVQIQCGTSTHSKIDLSYTFISYDYRHS